MQRQSNQSSSSGGGYSKSTSSPYQSQLYDSWKTEWDGHYYDHFRNGQQPSGGGGQHNQGYSSSGYQTSGHGGNGGGQATYLTKGGRRPSYDDDF